MPARPRSARAHRRSALATQRSRLRARHRASRRPSGRTIRWRECWQARRRFAGIAFNDDLIAQFRKDRGVITEGPFTGRDLLLLTTTGASSGRPRTHPLAYTRDGDTYLVIASMGGAPTHPAWYDDLRTHPEVIVEVGPEKFRAKATAFARGPERRRLYDQHAATNPGFKEHEQKTTRAIPTVLERLPS